MTETPENPDRHQRSQKELEDLVLALTETEAKLTNIINNAIEGIFQTDREGRFIHANPSFALIHGYASPAEIRDSIFARDLFLDPSDHERLIELLRSSGTVRGFESRMKTKSGTIHWVSSNVVAFGDEKGRTIRYEGTMLDITERKRAEEALLESEAKFRSIVNNALEGIFQTDREGRFIHANPSFAKIHGYASPVEMGDSLFAEDLFLDPSDHKRLIGLLRSSGSVQGFESRMKTKSGTVHWVSSNVMVFRDELGKTIRYEGTMLDITDRKKAEEALLESEERYRTAIESSNDAINILEGDICRYANSQYIKMFGLDGPEDAIGKSVKWNIHPDSLEMVAEMQRKRQAGEPVPSRYEFKGITKKGDIIYVEVSAAPITYRGKSEYLLYLRDVTERKEAEEVLIRSHKELERLNKAKTKAVNHISHELNTPISVIQSTTGILKRRFANLLTPAIENIIDILERNTERLSEISSETDEIFRVSQEIEEGMILKDIERLLARMEELPEIPEAIRPHWEAVKGWISTYLGRSPRSAQAIDLYSSVLSTVKKMERAAGHRNLRIDVEGQNDLFVFIDPFILREVTEGLIKNAIENTPEGGSIEVAAEQNDTGIILRVADRGIGITEENKGSVMDGLFHTEETDLYSTKRPFEFGAGGKGLELLRIKHYAERYGFDISFESVRCIYIPTDRDTCPGNIAQCSHCRTVDDCTASGGTTFFVTFPVRSNTGGMDEKK
ncbi:MAG TPA: PAS domain-containing sensor histidine kinase [Syntrophorhabdaceae bacterium]|jgi:PAS domain S-box-containing protein